MFIQDRKDRVTVAFKTLRQKGYFARQRFWCCSSCAWADIPEQKAEKAVFYHRQAAARFDNGEDLFLYWSGNGYEIVGILAAQGLTVEWDGSDAKAIVVKAV